MSGIMLRLRAAGGKLHLCSSDNQSDCVVLARYAQLELSAVNSWEICIDIARARLPNSRKRAMASLPKPSVAPSTRVSVVLGSQWGDEGKGTRFMLTR